MCLRPQRPSNSGRSHDPVPPSPRLKAGNTADVRASADDPTAGPTLTIPVASVSACRPSCPMTSGIKPAKLAKSSQSYAIRLRMGPSEDGMSSAMSTIALPDPRPSFAFSAAFPGKQNTQSHRDCHAQLSCSTRLHPARYPSFGLLDITTRQPALKRSLRPSAIRNRAARASQCPVREAAPRQE